MTAPQDPDRLEAAARQYTRTLVRIANEAIPGALNGELSKPVRYRAGCGLQTCCRAKPEAYEITLGARMVETHLKGHVRRWLHFRERPRLGWPTPCSIPDLVTHAVLHETAHAIQADRGDIARRSIHNPAFYQIAPQCSAYSRAAA